MHPILFFLIHSNFVLARSGACSCFLEGIEVNEYVARDDTEAISEENILDGDRTRGAKPKGGYTEPGDEEGLGGPDDGVSSGAQ